jgi:hypothetical protein
LGHPYVYWGGEIFHQQIGVAMGLIPAGLFATIVCFTCEIEFLRRCLARLNSELARDAAGAEIPKLRAKVYFALWLKRYIDDEFHTLVDAEAFDSSTALYDERTVFDGSQDGTDADGLYNGGAIDTLFPEYGGIPSRRARIWYS